MGRGTRPTQRWLKENAAWRLKALEQVARWVRESYPGDESEALRRIIVRRFAALERFVSVYFPEAPPAPFAAEDAAALIVLPARPAARLARSLFSGGGPGARDSLMVFLPTYNLDWFLPRGWRG